MAMKTFHISDLLSVTTGKLVSSRHMDGIYDVLKYLTNDNLFTHQLPRAMRECEPVLKHQFPMLFPDAPDMSGFLDDLAGALKEAPNDKCKEIVAEWVERVQQHFGLPDYVGIMSPMAESVHERKDPIAELEEMTGKPPIVITT